MKKLLILFLSTLLSQFAFSQPTNSIVKETVMPAPNAASLGKYGDIPVSLYTGTPSVSIPIYTIIEGPLNLPISLDYHIGSGVRVAETASWAGISWSLQAGGLITRTTQSKDDDELLYGFYHHGASDLSLSSQEVLDYLLGMKDGEPDIFSFHFPGYNGKLFFDANQDYHFVPKQDLKLEVDLNAGTFDRFTIITPDGTKYYFGRDPVETNRKAIEFSYSTGEAFNKTTASSWYLVRIESHDQRSFIRLLYEEETYSYKNLASRRYLDANFTGGECGGINNGIESSSLPAFDANHHYVQTNITGKRLSQITSNTTIIDFIASAADREDLGLHLAHGGTHKKLEEILISSGSFCSKFKLNHSYFHDKTNATFENEPFAKRLKLLSLQETDCNNPVEISKPPYIFEYEEEIRAGVSYLPHRLNKGTDHWGFYNGADGTKAGANNENLEVNVPPTVINNNGINHSYGSANRTPDFAYSKIGSLIKISYPSGGNTQFTFESNKYLGEVSNVPPIPRIDIDNIYCLVDNDYDITACCGTYNIEDTYTFTSFDQIEDMHFRLYMNEGCAAPNYSVRVDAFRVSDNLHIGGLEFTNAASQWWNLFILEQSGTFFEPNKSYQFKLKIINGVGGFYMEERPTTLGPVDAGGLRIQQILSHDGKNAANDIIKTYDYVDDASLESGQLFYQPRYGLSLDYLSYCYGTAAGGGGTNDPTPVQVGGAIFFDQSYVPLGNFDGKHIAYSQVKESLNGNGHRIFQYGLSIDYQAFHQPAFPIAPVKLNPFNGKATVNSHFNENNDLLAKTNTFAHGNPLITPIPQTLYKFNKPIQFSNTDPVLGPPTNPPEAVNTYLYTAYQMQTSVYRVAAIEKIIDDVSTTTDYEYDVNNRHFFPTKIIQTNSDNKKYSTRNEYAFDFSGAVYDSMISRNMIASPIRVIQEVENGSTVQTDGSYTIFDFFNASGLPGGSGNDPIYPHQFQRYEVTWDENNMLSTGVWELQGTIPEYDLIVGRPKRFQQPGWLDETYTWDATNKLIKTKTYKDFIWTYNYHPNTRLLAEIIDIDGQDIDFDFDQLLRLETITARDGNVITNFTYHFDDGSVGDYNYINQKTIYTPDLTGNSALTQKESRQYFGGLGKLLQTVQIKHSPDQKDVISIISYDTQGRPDKGRNFRLCRIF